MEDPAKTRLQKLQLHEIQELLADEGHDISLEQAQMIANFVVEAGGLDAAMHLLSELQQDRHAA